MAWVFWKRKRIDLGDQSVTELTILEWKKLFSLKLFHFHKTDGCQDRFHTHAFGAVSILLHGDYTEEVIEDGKILQLQRSRRRFLYIPRDSYHRITRSNGCRTILITGPWGEEFKELRDVGNDAYKEVVCGSQRVDLRDGETVRLTPPTRPTPPKVRRVVNERVINEGD